MAAARLLAPLALLGLLVPACDPAPANEEPPPEVEEGDPNVVLLVDDVEILASEAERFADVIQELYPEYAPNHCRRVAVGGTLLPRAALAARFAEERRAARARAGHALEELRAGREPDDVELILEEGTFGHLGLALWLHAREAEHDTWSGPVEQDGAFVLVRRRAVDPGDMPPRSETIGVQLAAFPYVPRGDRRAALDHAIENVKLTIRDPAWGELVPERYKYRMRGEPR
jgi:hypothetical protein